MATHTPGELKHSREAIPSCNSSRAILKFQQELKIPIIKRTLIDEKDTSSSNAHMVGEENRTSRKTAKVSTNMAQHLTLSVERCTNDLKFMRRYQYQM